MFRAVSEIRAGVRAPIRAASGQVLITRDQFLASVRWTWLVLGLGPRAGAQAFTARTVLSPSAS